MRAALGLARRGLGTVWPNPAVGCVLVLGDGADRVIGRGWTQPGGRPHAETEALRRAGRAAEGATAYVTLEPCDHHGATPPCSKALLEAGITRAVVAAADPDPRVSGSGIARLRAGGVAIHLGVCADEAAEVNAGFFMRVTRGRPLVTMKTATTLDGRIATRTGESRWITGETARAFVHRLRAAHDAVIIGSGTALADDPALTCRLPGLEDRSPVRVVLDGRLRLAPSSRLMETARETPTWLVTVEGGDKDRLSAYAGAGVEVIEAPPETGGSPALGWTLDELGRRGLTRVLVEGGGRLAAALLRSGLVDRLAWFRAPRLIGGDGLPAVAAFGVDSLSTAPGFARLAALAVGPDLLETYRRED